MRFQRYALPALMLATTISMSLVCSFPATAQNALPFVDPLFMDNMVLQRDVADTVWGWTTPGDTVTVSLKNKKATAVAGLDGKWLAHIGPFKAGGPYTLTVSGPQTATFNNVLVGDVWVCSGQSNMEFGVGSATNSSQEIANADYPDIRMFTVAKSTSETPQELTTGTWLPVSPTSITQEGTWNGFSAVGYFFGRDLQEKIKVPIGLIQSAWGGTPAEAWTSKEALAANLPFFNDSLARLEGGAGKSQAELEQDWYSKNDPGVAGNWQDPATDTSAWKPISLPGYFQQAGIPELEYVNGIVWFHRTFDLPASDIGKNAVFHDIVDDSDTTWINGALIGSTDGSTVNRAYAVDAALLKPTNNDIMIRDLDIGGVGGVHGDPPTLFLSVDGGEDIPMAGTWSYKLAAPLNQTTPWPNSIAGNPNYPTQLFNAMINPIDQFAIKGVLWYQGEANSGNAMQYRTLLPTMIADWRARWQEGNFPFLIVQLAAYQPGGPDWPELRQAQWLTAANVPNAGIVTAIDIGNQLDVHPKNKQEVGRRLALVAEAQVYGKKVQYSGPVYESASVQGSTIRISFSQVGRGLVATGGTSLTGFEIAGADGQFIPANAEIDGKSVVVSSPSVPGPVNVQYDWEAYPDGNLYNSDGLPAFPFKTDEK